MITNIVTNNLLNTNDKSNTDFDLKFLINIVLEFISTNLLDFKINSNELIKGKEEVCYNKQLLTFLDRRLRFTNHQFIIEGNQINKEAKYPDIEFLMLKNENNQSFFDIECKRLNSTFTNQHVSQYVNGNTGGIQRFKENKHGVDLPQSAMIGYVETNDFNFWHEKVNSWIMDSNEHLKILKNNNISKLESEHQRSGSKISKIKLTHFWLKMIFAK